MSEFAKRLGRVAVLYGGVTTERDVSIMSGENVLQALQSQGVDAFPVIIGEDPVRQLANITMDRAFNALHGKKYEDGELQGVLELLRIPYAGCGVLASAITFDKVRCKKLWEGMGLATPSMMLLNEKTAFAEVEAALGLPFVIKPSREGSSFGVHIVREQNQYLAGLKDALSFDDVVFAEAFLSGGEYTVSFLNDEPLPVIKIETPDAPFYDYHAKYVSNETQYLLPCGLSPTETDAISQLALRAYQATQCRHWARVDLMRDADGQFKLIDLNTLPGMTTHSLLPKAAAAIGLDFSTVVMKILENTLHSA